jgi:hypothetical protein
MKTINLMLLLIFLGAVPAGVSANSSNGAVHVCVNGDCEEVDDGVILEEDPGEERAIYYQNRIFDDPEENRDTPGWLEYETQWPGQREDFSDYLFR